MDLPIPHQDNLFFEADYRHLSQDFIDWLCANTLPDYDSADPIEYRDKKDQVESALTSFNTTLAIARIEKNEWLKHVFCLIKSNENEHAWSPELIKPLYNTLDWKSFYSAEETALLLLQMYNSNSLNSILTSSNAPGEITSWFQNLQIEWRVRLYIKSPEILPQFATYENIDAQGDKWRQEFLLKIINPALFKIIKGSDTDKLRALVTPDPESNLASMVLLLIINPERAMTLARILELTQALEIARISTSANNIQECLDRLITNSQDCPPWADTLQAQFRDAFFIEQSTLSALESLLTSAIKGQVAKAPLEYICSLIFHMNAFDYSMTERPEDQPADALLEILWDRFDESISEHELESWLRKRNPNEDLYGEFATEFLIGIAMNSDSLYPFYALLQSSNYFLYDNGDKGILTQDILQWANTTPGNMQRLLTLDCEIWIKEGYSHEVWIGTVLLHWTAYVLYLDSKQPAEIRSNFARELIQSQGFGDSLSIFNESTSLLEAIFPADVFINNLGDDKGLILQVLMACNPEFEHPYIDLMIAPDPILRVSKLLKDNPSWKPDTLCRQYYSHSDKHYHLLPMEFWTGKGVDVTDALACSLSQAIEETSPDIFAAVVSWQTRFQVRKVINGTPDLYDRLLTYPELAEEQTLLRIIFASDDIEEERYSNEAVIMRYPGVLEDARHLLIQLRKTIKSRNYHDIPESYVVDSAMNIVATLDSCWEAWRQLMMAFRALPRPAVNSSLAPINQGRDNEQLDKVGSRIASATKRCIRIARLKGELEELRRSFAVDLSKKLGKLKTARSENSQIHRPAHDEPGFDTNLKEPDPIWRIASIRALMDLDIKMSGKNHSIIAVLKKVEETDPSEKVRKTARQVYDDLNRMRNARKKGSAWRMVHQAWWWMRYAHRHSLNLPYDQQGAEKLRNNEFR
jgi:hypothetical protein